jgi:hypothetical protein
MKKRVKKTQLKKKTTTKNNWPMQWEKPKNKNKKSNINKRRAK